jgi:iron(III) transport system ATP-binding protein
VLLDEPLSNLDARLRLEMRSEIRRVCKENGLTAIYVTHDQKEALSISDRMAVLEGGRIAQIGTPEQVYRRPQTRVVADFIGETNFLNGKIQSLDGAKALVETNEGLFEGFLGDPEWMPSAGDSVSLSIRPESWSLRSAPASMNSVKGRIGESVYLGEVAQYQLQASAHDLKVFELNPHISARAQGQEFFALASVDDVVVLKP